MSKMQRLSAVAFITLFCSATFAATAAPIGIERLAARGVVTSAILQSELGDVDSVFAYTPRLIVDSALKQLAAATTFSALLAPGGVSLACATSGTLRARVGTSRPRVLKLEWNQCASSELGWRNVVNGPAEVGLPGDSLTPAWVASIRFGDESRDHVTNTRAEEPTPYYDGETVYRNLRVVGALPMSRENGYGNFLGRYVVQATGFLRRVQRLPEFNAAGEPSAAFYDYDNALSTDGALVTG